MFTPVLFSDINICEELLYSIKLLGFMSRSRIAGCFTLKVFVLKASDYTPICSFKTHDLLPNGMFLQIFSKLDINMESL